MSGIIPLVDVDDMASSPGRKKSEKNNEKKDRDVTVAKKKKEKPIRILRIRYYEKIILPIMGNGKLENREAFAVNRGLEDLLKSLYYNTDIRGILTPPDCIWVEKDDRIGANNKFIFIEINKDEFPILKRQLENHTTIYAFNKGEFIITEGSRSYLHETWNMPIIWKKTGKEDNKVSVSVSDSNKIIMEERLREELKDKFRVYHSRTDEEIDNMPERRLIELKKLSKEKMKMENRKRRALHDLLK